MRFPARGLKANLSAQNSSRMGRHEDGGRWLDAASDGLQRGRSWRSERHERPTFTFFSGFGRNAAQCWVALAGAEALPTTRSKTTR